MVLRAFMMCLLLMFLPGNQVLADEYIPPEVRDLSRVKMSLLTVGLGSDLHTRFGHTMLRVQDGENHLDYVVNWGIFSFEDTMFLVRFFRGILNYRMGFEGYRSNVRFYRDIEHRSLREDSIQLTERQKSTLIKKIIWNAQPENITYPYQYFRNNCSTIPRDYLDEALGGELKKRLVRNYTKMTYRDYVMSNLSNNPFVAWYLDITFNSDNDHLLTDWEEMFYPPKLREHLAFMPAFDDEGHETPKSHLLTDGHVLVDTPEPFPNVISGYWLGLILIGLPIAILFLSTKPWLGGGPSFYFDAPWQFRVFGGVSVLWGFACAIFGATHLFGWLWSAHTDFHHNINLMLFWPWDIVLLVWGFRMLLRGKEAAGTQHWSGVLRLLARAHLVMTCLYTVLVFSPMVSQNTSRVVLFMVPLSLIYNGCMLTSVIRKLK